MSFPPLSISAWLRYDAIRDALNNAAPHTLLEVGPGLGAMACRLARACEYTGIEFDEVSYEILSSRLAHEGLGSAILGSAEILVGRQFDMVCAFEVLEHIEDDLAALRVWSTLLSPGGHVLISVPAHARNFGPLDEMAGHFRRYDRQVLHQLLTNANFEVIRLSSYGFLLGQTIQWISTIIARRRGNRRPLIEATKESSRFLQPTSSLDGFVRWLAALPFRWLQRLMSDTDVGTGFVALARKRPE